MELGSISGLLADSKFADRAQEIDSTFERLGITTLNDRDNAPRSLGIRVAGYSTYQLCAYIREAAIQAIVDGPVIEELPELEPEPETVSEEVVVVLEQDEESIPEERSEE